MRKSGMFLASTLLLVGGLCQGAEQADAISERSYFELKPSLVTNLNGGPQYIRCDVQLMTEDPDRVSDIALHAPALRHEMLLLLVEQDGSKLTGVAGKAALRQRALAAIRKVLKQKAGDELVQDLYFTSYYVQ